MLTATCIFIASDTIMVYMVQHACGLLSLAGYRFKYSVDDDSWTDDYKAQNERTYKKVCYAVKAHKRALAFISEIENAYALNLFVQVGAVVLSFTITLLKVASITLSLDTYAYYGFVVVQLVHVFFLTVQGQFVIDLHDSLYLMEYEAYWYKGDIRTQALFVLILRRNLTPPLLTAGGLIQLNLDSFANIVKACVSYFTVLKSV
ncbi:odorant receptor coreceptor-like [Xylocopa sonorina]|uniref:odorant receptor coreceptor-like n=1 Tax=Xylocopa sonorina TaxID=1818115 RepID=UPI00403AB955